MDGVPYRVEVLPSAIRDTRRFSRWILSRIRAHLAALEKNPFPAGAHKLKGYERNYRIRVGQYRVIYEVVTEKHLVSIVHIAHRSTVYRSF